MEILRKLAFATMLGSKLTIAEMNVLSRLIAEQVLRERWVNPSDVVEEAAARVARSFSRHKVRPGSMRSYVRQACVWAYRDLCRRRQREGSAEIPVWMPAPAAHLGIDGAARSETDRRFARAQKAARKAVWKFLSEQRYLYRDVAFLAGFGDILSNTMLQEMVNAHSLAVFDPFLDSESLCQPQAMLGIEIADRLGVSSSTVTRYSQKLHDRLWLKIEDAFIGGWNESDE